MKLRQASALAALLVASTGLALAQQMTVDINRISSSGVGEKIGTVVLSEGKDGTSFKVSVKGLPAAERGFHVHEKGDCGPAMKDGKMEAGIAAGEHYDPDGHKSHKGPKARATRANLPLLKGNASGIEQTVRAPRLKLADVKGRSLMIREGGDNYSDQPENGGGKGCVACGVIPK
jgi:Cu-Zn family superoxide dismutase